MLTTISDALHHNRRFRDIKRRVYWRLCKLFRVTPNSDFGHRTGADAHRCYCWER